AFPVDEPWSRPAEDAERPVGRFVDARPDVHAVAQAEQGDGHHNRDDDDERQDRVHRDTAQVAWPTGVTAPTWVTGRGRRSWLPSQAATRAGPDRRERAWVRLRITRPVRGSAARSRSAR